MTSSETEDALEADVDVIAHIRRMRAVREAAYQRDVDRAKALNERCFASFFRRESCQT